MMSTKNWKVLKRWHISELLASLVQRSYTYCYRRLIHVLLQAFANLTWNVQAITSLVLDRDTAIATAQKIVLFGWRALKICWSQPMGRNENEPREWAVAGHLVRECQCSCRVAQISVDLIRGNEKTGTIMLFMISIS